MNECMNGWIEGLFDNRPVAFGTGTHLDTEKSKEIFPPNSDPKMLLLYVPNNVILAC